MNIEKCIEFIKIKHAGQKRKQGTPYYTHPLAVLNMLKEKNFGEEYQVAGLFHDLLEDTDCTEKEILDLSNQEVLKAVKLLTKTDGYIMKDYIDGISKNKIAKMVKLADRIHNLSEAKETSKEFQEKYIKETEDWFIDLSKGTVFEKDLLNILQDVINNCGYVIKK